MTNDNGLPAPATETDVLWFLPTHGDGRYLGSDVNARHITLNYLGQIARAADELGYFGVLLPTGKSCEDSWVVASAMVPAHAAPALSRRRAAGPADADRRCAHDCDARPPLRGSLADQRRHWRRSCGTARRRHFLSIMPSATR